MNKKEFYDTDLDSNEIDFSLKEQLDKYIIQKKWFLLSIVLCLIFAFLYLRYTTPNYEAITSILVKDEIKGGMLSELSAFSDLGLSGGSVNNVDNEIEILKSRTLVESTVNKLDLNISLLVEGNVVDRDIYGNSPISIYFLNKTELFDEANVTLKLDIISDDSFSLENIMSDENMVENVILSSKKTI